MEVTENLIENNCKSRQEILGFKAQKELIYNKFLPYPDLVDEESQRLLAEIKGNFGKAVLLKNITPGCVSWSHRLLRYVRVFGLKFSKEDHLTFIRMLCELIIIPNLEPYLVDKFLNVLSVLLCKKQLLSPEELTIPWRPFYDLWLQVIDTSLCAIGMYHSFPNIEGVLKNFLHYANPYFGPTTQEMLDLWRPKLCPFDQKTIHQTMIFLEAFLPVYHSVKTGSSGYELWFDEFMNLWKSCNNAFNWEMDMMQLMAKLASTNIGFIDWEPHLPFMFAKILRSLSLPVHYKGVTVSTQKSQFTTGSMAKWIVSVLGGNGSGQKYLDQMMKSVDTYLHPANTGGWVVRLKELLHKLTFHFVERLHKERIQVLTWQSPIPDTHKLTEDDITKFVECLKPPMMTTVFSKMDFGGNNLFISHLATLRPELIIPPLIDILYSTIDSLTEPHKYTSAMMSVSVVARPMVEGIRYEDGPTHVIPLLLATLPGIDPNDVRKSFITFQFITTFASLVPIVDCSSAFSHRNDLTPREEILCEATSQFEDFILQLLDRCFVFVESSVRETTRLERVQDKQSKWENTVESAISALFCPLLYQMSQQIFNSALRKLYSFATNCILETTVAGRYIAAICRTFARVRPEETLKMFIPHLCQNILTLTESNDVLKEETLSNELLYNMLLLSQIADCKSNTVLQHKELLECVLDRTLHMTSQESNMHSSRLLNNIMESISVTCPKEYQSSDEDYDKPLSEYLPVRDWGKAGNVQNLKVRWNKPSVDDVAYAQHLLTKYLPSELELIENALALSREQRLCSLKIIKALLACGSFLPLWDEPPLNLNENRLDTTNFTFSVRPPLYVFMPNGDNVRRTVAMSISKLQNTLLEGAEGDTKALKTISSIWGLILMSVCRFRNNFEIHWKSFCMGKKIHENRLSKGKKHLRSILIEQCSLQLELMELSNIIMPTATHQKIILNILELSTSRYSEVRSTAQSLLNTVTPFFPTSYQILIPRLVEILQSDSEENHDQFKGALYVLSGPNKYPIVTKPNWKVLLQLWPAIVKAKPSEKQSINKMLLYICMRVEKTFPTISINYQVPDSCDKVAEDFWKLSSPVPNLKQPSDAERSDAVVALEASNALNMKNYVTLLDSLVDAINNSNLCWRYQKIAVSFLMDLVHPDTDYPPHIVKSFLQMLNHDSLEIRKLALTCTLFVLQQQKRKSKEQIIDPKSVNKTLGYEMVEDNAWLQYNFKVVPKTAEEWDKTRYIHKMYVGYNGFPKELKAKSPSYEQPPLDRSWHQLTPAEQEVDAFFSDSGNVSKLLKFFCIEENKGRDRFNFSRSTLYKFLFRNFGDKYIDIFLSHLDKLVVDKQETSQRCAVEIISGIIQGSKKWPFDKVQKMWAKILPLIQVGLSNMTVETVGDWGVFATTASKNRDPHHLYWLLELLMEDPLRQNASFLDCGRLRALEAALRQCGWRVSQLHYRLLQYLQSHLAHPFQIIRARIASILVQVFLTDLPASSPCHTQGPYVQDFMKEILPKLACLYTLPSTSNHVLTKDVPETMDTTEAVTDMSMSIHQIKFDGNSEDKDEAIRLLKTVCKWIVNSLLTSLYSSLPEFFSLLPLIAMLESYEADEELKKACQQTLAVMAQSPVTEKVMPSALCVIKEVTASKSWWARETSLDFLQVFVFHNMAIFASQELWADEVISMVLWLLKDERVEVREKAGKALSGLLHIGFIPNPKLLLDDLKRLAYRSKKKTISNVNLIKLHAGVLGLCAFISANPYDVPDPVPEIFLLLGPHLNDPQPIPATIRRTLGNFKRTHHNNWEQHKLHFTEEQLAVLTDLNVPPSYIV